MKKCVAVLVAVLFVLFAGCSMLGMKGSKAKAVTGKVTIGFTLTRISGRASNQYAVWLEDETGRHVRTLFVTDYMTRRQGWKVRQQSLTTLGQGGGREERAAGVHRRRERRHAPGRQAVRGVGP